MAKKFFRKGLSILLSLTMLISVSQISAIAAGTEADPYDIGDVVTVEGTDAPAGEKAANSEWQMTASTAAVYAAEATCGVEPHTHSGLGEAGGCRELTCQQTEHTHSRWGWNSCYERNSREPSCGLDEHSHDEDTCYEVCEIAEHEHTDGECYALVTPATSTWTLQAAAVSVASKYGHIDIKTAAASSQSGKTVSSIRNVTFTQSGSTYTLLSGERQAANGSAEWTFEHKTVYHDAVINFSAQIDGKWYDISLDKYDTYPEDTYYNGDAASKLGTYFGISHVEGKGYDISGKSVFLVSAIACNGSSVSLGRLNKVDGLDLVLNIETILDNATNAVSAIKILAGAELEDGQFSFQLIDSNGEVLQTKTNAADGSIAFDPITYSAAGTYTYTVKEVAGTEEGYTYDASVYTVTLVVAKNSALNAYQVTSTTITKNGAAASEIVFENSYEEKAPVLSVTKTADKAAAMAGEVINYTITVTNTGNAAATGVTVTDTPDANLVVDTDALAGGTYDAVAGTITWTAAEIAAGGFWSVTIPMTLSAANGSTATNTVTISGGEEDEETVELLGGLEITKVAAGAEVPADASFTVTGPDSYTKIVKYSQFTDGKYVLEDLALGEYTVTENAASAQVAGYELTVTGGGTVTVSVEETAQITVTNTYTEQYKPVHTLGTVTVSKVSSGAETPASAAFQLQKLNGTEWANVGEAVVYSAFTSGAYTFSELGEGTYRVVESGAEVEGYDLVTTNDQTAALVKTTAANGDTDVNDGTVAIVNVYTKQYVPVHTLGTVTVSKTSTGAETPAAAAFQLQKLNDSEWANVGEAVAYSAFVSGAYTFSDLAEGTYRVVESGAAVAGYDLVTTNDQTATLVKTTAANGDTDVNDGTVAIVNVYTKQYVPTHSKGSIVLTKASTGAETPATAVFQLQKLNVSEWADVGEAVAYSAFVSGSYTFSDLGEGTYRVVESGAAIAGYDLVTANDQTATLTKTVSAKGDETVSSGVIAVINTYTEQHVPTHSKGSITVSKASTGAETPATAVFQLQKLNGSEWANVGEAVAYSAFVSGSYTFSDLGEGTYRVVESGAAVAGYDLLTANDQTAELVKTVSAKGDETVSSGVIAVINAYTEQYVPTHSKGSITVSKASTGAETPATAVFQLQKLNGTGWANVGKAVAYAQFTNGTYTFSDLAEGTYRVVESGAAVAGYDLVTTNDQTVELVKTLSSKGDTTVNSGAVAIVNAYTEQYVPIHSKGSIVLTKASAGAETPASAAFQLQKLNGTSWADVGKAVAYSEFVNGAYTFSDLAEGTYRVVESGAAVKGYDLVTANDQTAELVKTTSAKGDTTVSSGAIQITNSYAKQVGSLQIVKTTSGNTTPAGTTFTVTGPNGYSLTVKYSQFVDGVYTVTGLEPGIYLVTEDSTSAQVDGYTLQVSGSGHSVEVAAGGTAQAGITNSYFEVIIPPGKLQIIKKVEGLPAGTEIPADTRFDIIDYNAAYPSNPVVETVYWKDFNDSGFVIVELPAGQYTVVEDLASAAVDGYGTPSRVAVYDGDEANYFATVVSGEMAKAEYTNTYEKVWTTGSLTVSKTFNGLDDAALRQVEKNLSFTVTGENGFEKTFTAAEMLEKKGALTYTLSDLEPGIYTIAENGAEAETGYDLSVSAPDADAAAEGYQIRVTAGETAAAFRITNNYTSRIYNIWFEGGLHGTVEGLDGEPINGVWRSRWLEIGADDNGDGENDHKWSGFSLKVGQGVYTAGTGTIYDGLTENHVITETFDTTERDTGLVLYTFTWGQWKSFGSDMDFMKPSLDVESGWKTTGEFYIPGTDVKFTSIEDAVNYMNDPANGVEPDVNGIYNVLYMPLYEKEIIQPKYGSISVEKKFFLNGSEQAEAISGFNGSFELQKLEGGEWSSVQTVSWNEFADGSYTFEDLALGTYRIVETGAEVDGYEWSSSVVYVDNSGTNTGSVILDADEKAEIVVKNTYTIPFTPGPGPGEEPEIPDVPEIPETPENPEVPETPDVPETPEEPDPVIEIPDEPTPLSDLPDGGEELTDLPDEEVPLTDIPKTGDDMILYLFLTALSGAGLLWLALSGKKREEELL